MVTPFDDRGAVDLAGAATLAKWLVDHGNDGLVIAGTTGEAATLSHDEQIDLIAAVVEAVDVPVVAGAGSNNTTAAMELTERATAAGASAILQVTPYYNRPSQQGIADHFRATAEATNLPVIVYDIPVRTGRKIETELILELAHSVDNIVALKDAAGNPGETAQLISRAPDGFEVYSGDDDLTLPFLSVGAVGTIGVATHWTGPEHQAMFEAWNTGDIKLAQAKNTAMQPSFVYKSYDDAPNPTPTKALMRLLGLPVGHCRPPMHAEPADLDERARTVLAGVEVGD